MLCFFNKEYLKQIYLTNVDNFERSENQTLSMIYTALCQHFYVKYFF